MSGLASFTTAPAAVGTARLATLKIGTRADLQDIHRAMFSLFLKRLPGAAAVLAMTLFGLCPRVHHAVYLRMLWTRSLKPAG